MVIRSIHGDHCIDRNIFISPHILKYQLILDQMKSICDGKEAMNIVSWIKIECIDQGKAGIFEKTKTN